MPKISKKIALHLPTWGLACSDGGYSPPSPPLAPPLITFSVYIMSWYCHGIHKPQPAVLCDMVQCVSDSHHAGLLCIVLGYNSTKKRQHYFG